MKVGDYLRLEDGTITRFGGSDFEKIINGHYINCAVEYFHTKKIIKSSPNIIDLIQVGDYVNGYKVIHIAQAPIKALYLNDINQRGALIPVCENDIKSIVTKEQFKSMEYKIKE